MRPCARAASADPFAQGQGALLIGLDRDSEPAPAVREQRVVGEQRLEHVELELEPVGLLGVDGEMDVGLRCLQRQLAHDRKHRGDRFGLMRIFIARVERGQLDRNARRLAEAAFRLPRQAVEGAAIGVGIALGIREGLRRLAEHVEAVGEAFPAFGRGALQGFVDGPAEDEIAPEDFHRLAHRRADHGFAQPPDRAAQRRAPIVGAVVCTFEHLSGQQQREGRGVDERAVELAELFRPVGSGELVGDQFVGGVRVGDAKQRLGQAHHRDSLVRAEVVGLQKRIDAGRLLRADALDQSARGRRRFTQGLGIEPRLREPLGDDHLFVGSISPPQFAAVDRGRARRDQAGCPWQCLYFLPDPHGHGALRLIGASTTPPPSSRSGSGGWGMLSKGKPASRAPVAGIDVGGVVFARRTGRCAG